MRKYVVLSSAQHAFAYNSALKRVLAYTPSWPNHIRVFPVAELIETSVMAKVDVSLGERVINLVIPIEP